MIIQTGDSFDECDDANIPVDITLEEIEKEDRETLEGYNEADEEVTITPSYVLRASNYMPRKDCVSSDGFEIVSDKREELIEVVKRKIIPLYKNALEKLEAICEGKETSLYYWDKLGE